MISYRMVYGMPGDYALTRSLTTTESLRLTFRGEAAAVRLALQDIMQSPQIGAQTVNTRQNAEIVLAEVFNNIVEHAYARSAGDITVVLHVQPFGVDCQITDTGAPMPGLALPAGGFQALGEISTLPEGGFGWFLIRSLTEELTYQHLDGRNFLSFILKSEQPAV